MGTSRKSKVTPVNNSNQTRVICPKCGAEIAIPETSSIAIGIAVGKDSNLGTIVLPSAEDNGVTTGNTKKKKPVTPEEKMAALKAAGIDVTNFFVIPGSVKIYHPDNGTMVEIDEQDPVIKKILEGGDAPVYRLFRRWVMAQMFRMLNSEKGFVAALNNKGYFYQWRMIADEFHTQTVLLKKDPDYFPLRNMWFNGKTLSDMIEAVIKKITKEASKSYRNRTKIIDGYVIAERYIGTASYKENMKKLERLQEKAECTASPYTLSSIAKEVLKILSEHFYGINRKWKVTSAFLNAYEGSGSYYTMENLIRFHNCRFYNPLTGKKLDEYKSLEQLKSLAMENANNGTGYKMMGILQEFLKVNKIDVAKKIASWRK